MNDFNFYREGLEYFEKVWKIVKKEIPLIGDSNNLQILSMNIHTNHSKMYVLIRYDVYKECLYKKGIVHKEDEENLNITYKILPGKDPKRVDYEIDKSLALGLSKPKKGFS